MLRILAQIHTLAEMPGDTLNDLSDTFVALPYFFNVVF